MKPMELLAKKSPNVPPQVLPFAFFMAFIGLVEGLHFLAGSGLITLPVQALQASYPVKVLATGGLLLFLREKYREISLRDLFPPAPTLLSVVTGLAVFALWVNMDWKFATIGTPAGYNPQVFADPAVAAAMTGFRLIGAVVVVPVMEELFWRSFLLRYIVDPDYQRVPVGRFTWTSFLLTVVLFGLEHNLYLAGMMAGAAYSLLLYRTKSIAQCILAHAVTNLALGVYVLRTGNWQFW